ncbi:dockerin type I domain-containing protein [Mucisphaera sp.]|uniref:dockerin type I domain-containing protein n=1 Tax=Mucisphaera sp. TaxID=2913024 RepID=UPI003D0E0E0A
MFRHLSITIAAVLLIAAPAAAQDKLYGVHWWDYDGNTAGPGTTGGLAVETIITHSAPWWSANYFLPLYQQATTQHNATFVTRIDYNWGETVPSPNSLAAADWATAVLDAVNTLGDHANIWVIGNEPNVTSEGNNWPDQRIQPADYASIYTTVRTAIKAQRPDDLVLLAPPSPGPAGGIRWMSGNDYLAQTIDAVIGRRGGAIDGFALHAYGNPFTSNPTTAAAGFQASYIEQLNIIDNKGFQDAPVWITEWARSTSTTGDLAANEAVTAQFITQALADLHDWNQTPGNHNIVSTAWFVNQGYGGWDEFALEWWATRGNPAGDPNDMLTAMLNSAQYPAGLYGTRPNPFPGDLNADGLTDHLDINLLFANLGNPAYDVDGNNTADFADVAHLIRELIGTEFGDINLDQAVDLIDLSILATNFNTTGIGWQRGDFNGDTQVNLNDLSVLATYFGFNANPAIPTPATATLIATLVPVARNRQPKDTPHHA